MDKFQPRWQTYFKGAIKDIPKINSRFGGMLSEMMTHQYSINDNQQVFATIDPKHIKTLIVMEPRYNHW